MHLFWTWFSACFKVLMCINNILISVNNSNYTSVFFKHPLREKCPNTEIFLVRILPHSDWIRRDTEYLSVFSPNAGNYEPEKTPYSDTFHAVILALLIDVLKKSEPDQAHIFQYTFWKNFELHLQVVACCFERTNHDTHLDFFKVFPYSFYMLRTSICNVFHV